MRRRTVGRWALLILVLCSATAGYAQNPIQTENLKAGTTDWQLTNPALNHEIEGYASLTSVNRGGQISFYVNTSDPTYTIDIFRAGWYGLAGGRRVMSTIALSRTAQPACPQDAVSGMTECQWTNPYVLTVPGSANDPTNWASGVYLAMLTGQSSGKQSYIIFVVRDDARPSPFLFALNVTTYQAYNNWGGKSLYDYNSNSGRASKVSYNRPYAGGTQNGTGYTIGAGEFLTNYAPDDETWPAAWEYNAVRWLEKEGYDVTYATSVDLHEQSDLLGTHAAYLSFGHNEYWSMAMFNNVTAARDNGVNLGFFGANVAYWQIRFESSPVTGQPNRTQVCYKSTNDPVTGPTRTIKFRDLGLPESALVGVYYATDPVHGDIVVQNTSHWFFQNSGLNNGDRLTGLLGYEVDVFDPSNSPPGTILLGNSPFGDDDDENSHMSVYTAAASGATVFATGSMQWVWGLDEYNSTALRPSFLSLAAQQITKNILSKFTENFNPLPPFTPIRVNSGGADYADSQGQIWSADTGFTGGSTASTTAAITNTADQTLYKSERYGAFSYNFTVPAGAYSVNLRFAEIFYTVAGQRMFNVAINGTTVLSNFDIVGQAGGANRALDRNFTVNSTGTITIQFLAGSVDLPKVSAIEIVSTSGVSVQVNPTWASLSGSQTQQFAATVMGSANTAVTWSLNPSVGTLSSAGLYTAPSTITTQQVVTVTATSAANPTKSASATVTLNPADFSISASPSSRTVGQGSGSSYTATITPSNGFSAAVALSVSGLPAGAGGTFSPASVSGSGTSTLSVTTAASTPAGAYAVTITGTSGTLVRTTTATLIVSPPAGGFFPIRVNSGGAAYADSQGLIWSADTGFTDGSTAAVAASTAIANTVDDVLYRSERYNAFTYGFTVPAGSYQVTLKFAETYFTSGAASGQRVFNVAINGTTVLTNFDIKAVAGGANIAVDRNFAVNAGAGSNNLQIQFIHVAGQPDLPKVDAIEIVSAGVSAPTITTQPANQTVTEGQTATFTVAASGSGPISYQWRKGGVNIAGAASSSYTTPATVTGDSGAAFDVLVSNAAGEVASNTATLTVNALTVASVVLNPASVTGGTPSTGTVTLNGAAPAGGAVVDLTSSNLAAATVPATVTVQPNATSATFAVATSAVGGVTPVTISATYQGTKTATLTVHPAPSVSSVTVNPTSVTGGANSTGTVTLNAAAPAGGAVVALSSSNTAAATVAANVTVPANSSTATFTVNTQGVAGVTPVTITATLNGSATATLTVNAPPSFNPIRVNSGGAAYADSQGLIWSADTGFTGGSTASTTAAITNTADQTLYKAERYGAFSYNFTAPSGAYSVTLKFAEFFYTASGRRIFSVAINGTTVLSNFDIVAQAGGANRALDRTFAVNSTGTITIQFLTGSADLPKVSAIEIVSTSGVSVQVNPTWASLSGSQTQQFTATVTGSANTAVTWSLNPSVGTLSSVGLYTAPNTITTQQVVTVTATSAADTTKSASAAVTLIPPDFSISASPSSRTVVQGSGTSYTATITPSNGFSAAVALSVSGLPAGAGGTFSPTSVSGSGTSTLSVTTAASTPAGAYTVTITGTSGTLVRTTTTTLIVNPPAGSFTPIRVNSGGAAYADSQGLIWSADTGFTGGSTAAVAASTAIANTVDDVLYRSERYNAFTYGFTVPAGSYQVTLKFAETYFTSGAASGQRVFNVAINGTTVLTNFDIKATAGGANIAVDRNFAVNAGAGSNNLQIQFIHVAGQPDLPKVDAIAIASGGG